MTPPYLITLIGVLSALIISIAILGAIYRNDQDTEHMRQLQAAKDLDVICDRTSMTITSSQPWPEDTELTVTVYPTLRQVFRISVPGIESFTRARTTDPSETNVVWGEQVRLPDQLGEPITMQPRMQDLTTAEAFRARHLTRLAAQLNLDQRSIDATMVELLDHQITYTLEYGFVTQHTAEWMSYAPHCNHTDPTTESQE